MMGGTGKPLIQGGGGCRKLGRKGGEESYCQARLKGDGPWEVQDWTSGKILEGGGG